jgi:predicted membrane-bound spermidine synthase
VIPFLYVLFFLSGAAGLLYESVWSRYLSLFVGHGAYAQVIVLVIFLGGMAAGAALVSRITGRLRDPLYGYALIEVSVGILGLLFHDVLYVPITNFSYDVLFPALGGGAVVLVAKWAIAGLLILPQSILLGATFPLMSAGVLRRMPNRPGGVLSWLYFSNSLGAALGVLVAGFYLVSLAGLPGTLIAAAIVNLVVGLGALIASKSDTGTELATPGTVDVAVGYPLDLDLLPQKQLLRVLLALSAGTAIASFIYEVAWIRLLSLVLGSATHSFELMLSAFILGLALGAFWIRKRAEQITRPLLMLAWIQVFMGMLAAASLAFYGWSFSWMADLMAAVGRTDAGYAMFSLLRYGIALVIMLPATFCAGMTLPLITRSLLVSGTGEKAIGAVYGSNTLGSIVGAGMASLVVIPVLGLKGTLLLGAIGDMGLGVWLGWVLLRHGGQVRQLLSRGVFALLVIPLMVALGVRLDRALLTSGVFRTGQALASVQDTIVYYRDGRTATVAATKSGERRLTIATNGKPDGSLAPVWLTACAPGDSLRTMGGDDPTQILLALITMAHRPNARTAAVIGHGTGMSSHTLLASPGLEALVTVEIEAQMIPASRIFYPANRRVFDDPRSRHVFDDAKAYFAAANTTFDLIMAEPSNPWVSGVSGLFTDEFYQRVGRYISPGGVLGQWLHTYELTDELVLTVLSAIHRNFSDYAIYTVNLADLLIVATPTGRLPEPDWRVVNLPLLQEDLCHFHPLRADELAATRLTGRAALGALLDQISPNSDFYPVLDLGAERARFLGRAAAGIENLYAGVFDFAGPPSVTPPLVPSENLESGLTSIPRVRQLNLASTLRAKTRKVGTDSTWTFELAEERDERAIDWRRALAGDAPRSWAVWSRGYWAAFGLWHAGSRGYLDPAFSGEVHRFLDRHQAPGSLRAVVEFREGLATRDWAAVVQGARVLRGEANVGDHWVDPDPLREGSVMAWLALGQSDSAAAVFAELDSLVTRPPGDLRVRLLRSYLGGDLQKP